MFHRPCTASLTRFLALVSLLVSFSSLQLSADDTPTAVGPGFSSRIVDGDGKPVTATPYLILSTHLKEHRYRKQFPRTGVNGEISCVEVQANESLAIVLLREEGKAYVWTGIASDSQSQTLTTAKAVPLDLPPSWETFGDLSQAVTNAGNQTKSVAFSLPEFDGHRLSVDDKRFAGKTILLNIWGTWCPGCKAEIPHLIDLQKELKSSGLEVVGIAFERESTKEAIEMVKAYTTNNGMKYTVLFGGDTSEATVEAALPGLSDFEGFPTTIIIDRQKRVRYIESGFKMETPERAAWCIRQLRSKIMATLESN